MADKVENVSEPKIQYTRRDGIYVKPPEIAKTERGRELIKKNSKSKLSK